MSKNNMTFHVLVKNILVLNSVKVGDKLIINSSNNLLIDPPFILRSFFRSCSPQSREKTHLFIIDLILKISKELTKYLYFHHNQSNYSIDQLYIKNWEDFDFYLSEMKNISKSIDILSETYKRDKTFIRKFKLNKNLIDEMNPNYQSIGILQ